MLIIIIIHLNISIVSLHERSTKTNLGSGELQLDPSLGWGVLSMLFDDISFEALIDEVRDLDVSTELLLHCVSRLLLLLGLNLFV